MKYNVFVKGHTYSFNYDPKYEPMDFLRNNDEISFFKIENWVPKVDMKTVIVVMSECYKQLLEENYL